MTNVVEISGKNLVLKPIDESYAKEYYLNWLLDKEVNQYLETRLEEQNIDKIKEFIKSIRESSHSYLFAIIYQNKHIGNIKIGPIDPVYKKADVSYFIGDKTCWGKGLATEAVYLILKFGFEVLNLKRIEAGAFEQNVASQKVLLKNKFKKEGTLRKSAFLNKGDSYCDIYKYGILKEEF